MEMKRSESNLTFGQLMEINKHLPACSEIEAVVLRLALVTATEFEQFTEIIETVPDGSEIEMGVLKLLLDTADTFDDAETAYLYCNAHNYREGMDTALEKMLRKADTEEQVHDVYVYAATGSEIGRRAEIRLRLMAQLK